MVGMAKGGTHLDRQLTMCLEEMGLSEYEAKAYLSVLHLGKSTAKELAEVSGIPQPRIYDVLESLKEKGFVTIQPGRPKKFGPIQPKHAIDQYQWYMEDEFEKQLEDLQNTANEFTSRIDTSIFVGGNHSDVDTFWSYDDKDHILKQIGEEIENADSKMDCITTNDSLERIINHYQEKISSKDMDKIRILVSNIEDVDNRILEFVQKEAQIKPIDPIAGRLYIFDTDKVFITFPDENMNKYVGLSAESEHFHRTLSLMFDSQWRETDKISL